MDLTLFTVAIHTRSDSENKRAFVSSQGSADFVARRYKAEERFIIGNLSSKVVHFVNEESDGGFDVNGSDSQAEYHVEKVE